MTHIQWYPGHIAKAQRELKNKLSLVDVVIEVIDARIPYSSQYQNIEKICSSKPRLIIMNKSDLSDEKYNIAWKNIIYEKSGCETIITDIKNKKDIKIIVSKICNLANEVMKKRIEKGLMPRPTRTMVIGLPNVGKSSTINKLTKSSKTKTGSLAGVTKQQQWVRINEKIELLDTPGIIPMALDDQKQAVKLACVNSVGINAYISQEVAQELLIILLKYYEKEIRTYFSFENDEEISIENIALKKNWLLKGTKPDIKRASEIFLSSFRMGKIGKFTLERPEEYGLI